VYLMSVGSRSQLVAELIEPLRKRLQRVVQSAAHCAEWNPGSMRDLLTGKVAVVVLDDGVAMLGTQPLQCVRDDQPRQPAVLIVRHHRLGGFRNRDRAARRHAGMIDDDIPQNCKQPRAGGTPFSVIGACVPPRAHEDLLHQILGRGRARRPSSSEAAELGCVCDPQATEAGFGAGIGELVVSSNGGHTPRLRIRTDVPLTTALRVRGHRVSFVAARRQPQSRPLRRMSRRKRQQEEVARALERGDVARALVLAGEHLREYPDDVVVQEVAEQAERLLRQTLFDE